MTSVATDRGPDVSIVVVTHDSEQDLATCLEAALAQEGASIEVVVVDNASSDGTLAVAERFADRLQIVPQARNLGFAQGMNVGIDATTGRFVLALNPDCRLEPDFCAVLTERLDRLPQHGSASGRLLRGEGVHMAATDTLDSTGMYFTATGRHFDRGSGEPAAGRYEREEPVFGVTGAAGFYRRSALERVRISTGYFDSDFFAYREDADLAWRLQHAGWSCLYVPQAVAVHRRANLPERRSQMSELINYHSVKNRFLLRINNQTRGEFMRTLLPTLSRDWIVFIGCLVRERSSLPAFSWLWANRRRLWAKRREVQSLGRSRR